MRELLGQISQWRAEGECVCLATVIATRDSAPRPVGSTLAIGESGRVAGSVSGGCVEAELVQAAQELFAGAQPRLLSYGIPDDEALAIGLPCGGEIDVFVQHAPDDGLLARLVRVDEREENAVLLTTVAGTDTGRALLWVAADAPCFQADELESIAARALEGGRSLTMQLADRRMFAEVFGQAPRLIIYGAVDLAEELCRAAKLLGWRTIVADARSALATDARIPSADELLVGWPAEALAEARPDCHTAIVLLTHEDRFQQPALTAALDSDAFYIGALGSRRAQRRRRAKLLEAGFDDSQLSRISGPCGLDLGAETPPETAVSILAEVLAVRNGRAGGRLRAASGTIHVRYHDEDALVPVKA